MSKPRVFKVSRKTFEIMHGICLNCGQTHLGNDKLDESRLDCLKCGARAVRALPEALRMGRVKIVEQEPESELTED